MTRRNGAEVIIGSPSSKAVAMRYAIPEDATVHTPVERIMCSTSVQLAYLVAAFAVRPPPPHSSQTASHLAQAYRKFCKATALPTKMSVKLVGGQVHEKAPSSKKESGTSCLKMSKGTARNIRLLIFRLNTHWFDRKFCQPWPAKCAQAYTSTHTLLDLPRAEGIVK